MLAVMLNNCDAPARCALCGTRIRPVVGPELFTADTHAPVCRPCGLEHEPELTALVDLARTAEDYAGRLYLVSGAPVES